MSLLDIAVCATWSHYEAAQSEGESQTIYDDGLTVVFSWTIVAPEACACSVAFATVSFISSSGPLLLPCDLMIASDSVGV